MEVVELGDLRFRGEEDDVLGFGAGFGRRFRELRLSVDEGDVLSRGE